jgi:hypothetical protein
MGYAQSQNSATGAWSDIDYAQKSTLYVVETVLLARPTHPARAAPTLTPPLRGPPLS